MADKKLTASGQVRQKIIQLMTGEKIKPSNQKLGGLRIIGTVWKQVEDAETAIKEANAARLARAKFNQALSSNDPGVVCAMLGDVEDDGTAGAALLILARQAISAKKRDESLHATNEANVHKRDVKAEKYRKTADDLGLNWRDDPYNAAEEVQAKLKEARSVRTIARAFGAK